MSDHHEHGWLTVTEAARYVGVSESMIRGAVNKGELKAYTKPSEEKRRQVRALIKRTDVDEWVRSWEPAHFGPLAGLPL